MSNSLKRNISLVAILGVAVIANADHSPQHERHELMEGVRDAAKPIGGMLRGKIDYDADVVMESLTTWKEAAEVFGGLFPEGTDTGEGTEAAPTIWTDRAGFDAALADWADATNAAIAAAPQTLDEAKGTVGPIFQKCKACHDTYRIEDEE